MVILVVVMVLTMVTPSRRRRKHVVVVVVVVAVVLWSRVVVVATLAGEIEMSVRWAKLDQLVSRMLLETMRAREKIPEARSASYKNVSKTSRFSTTRFTFRRSSE